MINKLKLDNQRATIYLAGQVIVQLLTTFSIFLFTRLLSTEEYGIVAVYMTWSVFLSYLIGLQSSGTIEIAKVHKESQYEQYCLIPIILANITGLIILMAICIFFGVINRVASVNVWMLFFMIFHAWGISCINTQNNIYRMEMQAIKYIEINVLLNLAIIVLPLILTLGMKEYKAIGRILGTGIPYIIIGGYFCIKILRNNRISFDKELYDFCIKLSIPLVFHSISAQVLNQSDRVMLSAMRNNTEVGIYSFGYSVGSLLVGVWSALNSAWTPDYNINLKRGNMKWIENHASNYLYNFTSLICGYLLICREVYKIMGTKEYWIGEDIVPIIAVIPFLQFLYSFPVSFEFYKGRTNMIAAGTGMAAIINIIINRLFIPQFGMFATAFSTIISYFLLFFLHDKSARKTGEYHYKWNFYIKGIIPVFLCFICAYLLKDYMLIRWGAGGVIGVALIRHIKRTKTLL